MKTAVIFFLALTPLILSQTNTKVTGAISDSETHSPLFNANVFVATTNAGTVTDSSGRYSIQLPYGSYEFRFSYVGYETKRIILRIKRDDKTVELNAELRPIVIEQEQVNVTGDKYPESPAVQRIEGENIQNMPTIFDDVLRSIKILPGVISNDELSSGYNVRGGNYDQNLIYLNGFEIHRPFLIKEGLEEGQSLINQNLVKDLHFFAGAFPANFGDKISSALDVKYKTPDEEGLRISGKVDLLKANSTIAYKSGDIGFIVGARYAYPSLISDALQRKGDYNPLFRDVQFFGNYKLTEDSDIELLAIYGDNRFNLVPTEWDGFYKLSRFDVKEVFIEFDGDRNYSLKTGLLGVTFDSRINTDTRIKISAAYYDNNETENTDFYENIYFNESPNSPESPNQFLKSRVTTADNKLHLKTYHLKTILNYLVGDHSIETGLEAQLSSMNNQVNEGMLESGPDSTLELPYNRNFYQETNFNSISAYGLDQIVLNDQLQINAGLRVTHYFYNDETTVSPRISLFYTPSIQHTINLSLGYYFQQPFAYELKNNPVEGDDKLKSQKAMHYILGWEYRPELNSKYQFEIFYKKMDDLIPYNIEKMQIQYIGKNEMEGYAYGLDFQYQGELVEGIKSWVGYSFLQSKERFKEGDHGYQRSLMDQRHTFKVFLQDRMKGLPHFQSHVRFLFGTGLLYHPKEYRTDEASGKTYMEYNLYKSFSFPFYFRVDMGLTFDFKLGESSNLTVIAEVLNVFDKDNVADFNWYRIYPLAFYPARVAQKFSKRFFNIGVEVSL